jgi:hypothetical protein
MNHGGKRVGAGKRTRLGAQSNGDISESLGMVLRGAEESPIQALVLVSISVKC